MAAFLKTLFGDVQNVAVVAVLLAAEAALVHAGHGQAATILVPVATMFGTSWLASR